MKKLAKQIDRWRINRDGKINYKNKDHIAATSFRFYWNKIRKAAGIGQEKTLYKFRRTVAQRVYDAYGNLAR